MDRLAALMLALGLQGCARQADVASPVPVEPQSVPFDLDFSSIDVHLSYTSEPGHRGQSCHYDMEIYLDRGCEDEQHIMLSASNFGDVYLMVVGGRSLPPYSESKGSDLAAWNFALYIFRPAFSGSRQLAGIAEALVGTCVDE